MPVFRNVAAVALVGLGVGAVPPAPVTADRSVNIPVGALGFYRNKDGLIFANAWGDPARGPHSNYIRLPGSSASPLHVHTASYYGVVISGVVANERQARPDRPLGPGSYWYQRGGEPHVTKCLSRADCLIFVTSRGAFDIRPVASPRSNASSAEGPR